MSLNPYNYQRLQAEKVYAASTAADPRRLSHIIRWVPSKKQGKRRINKKGKANG